MEQYAEIAHPRYKDVAWLTSTQILSKKLLVVRPDGGPKTGTASLRYWQKILVFFAAYESLVIVDVGVKEAKTVESILDLALFYLI